MTSNVLKIAQRAALAAMFVSSAAFAQPAQHEYVTVTPKQENVWGAKIDVPNQAQQRAYVNKNVFGAQIKVPAPQIASADIAAQNAVFQGN